MSKPKDKENEDGNPKSSQHYFIRALSPIHFAQNISNEKGYWVRKDTDRNHKCLPIAKKPNINGDEFVGDDITGNQGSNKQRSQKEINLSGQR